MHVKGPLPDEFTSAELLTHSFVQSKGELEEVGETVDSGEYNVYSTFQSHEPDFDYLKSLEIEEKINKIRWLPQQNAAHFLLSTNGETPATPVLRASGQVCPLSSVVFSV